MSKSFQQIKGEMVRGLRIKRRRTKTPVIIALVGVSGVGNSTIARVLAKNLGWTTLEKNKIRVKLREEGTGFTPVNTDEIYYAMLKRVLRGKGNAILDSDFVEKAKRKKLEKFAKRFEARVVYLHLICDQNVMIERTITGKYHSQKDIFKSAAVAVREHCRRYPWHYRWQETGGGSYRMRRLPIKFFAEINTTHPNQWKKKLRIVARRLHRM